MKNACVSTVGAISLFLLGCEQRISGTYERKVKDMLGGAEHRGASINPDGTFYQTWDFRSDGTVIFKNPWMGTTQSGTYNIKGNRIIMDFHDKEGLCVFRRDGDDLIDNGNERLTRRLFTR